VVPVIVWSTRGTPITAIDTFRVVLRPFLSILIGAGVTLAALPFLNPLSPALIRLIASSAVLFGVYAIVLWFIMGQKAVYLGLLREVGVWPFAGGRGSQQSLQPGEVQAAIEQISASSRTTSQLSPIPANDE
jgi:hypothetical protein